MQLSTPEWISIGAAALFLLISFSIFSSPFRLILKFLLNAVLGLAGLIICNIAGLSLALNPITVSVTALLGLPGLVLLILIKIILL
jgi:inhibitor of the pro-sigma K processing machinery